MSITIYGTPTCPKCDDVKKYLASESVPYTYQEVGKDIVREQLELVVGRTIRSVPVIVVHGQEYNFDGLKSFVAEVKERQKSVDITEVRI